MPWTSLKEAEDAGANTTIDGIALTLDQLNEIAAHADAIGGDSDKGKRASGWAIAISYFKKTHEVKDGKWTRKPEDRELHSISFDSARVDIKTAKRFMEFLGREDLEPVQRNGRIYFAEKETEFETEEFPNVRVFEAGTWTGMSGKPTTYTEDDIKQIAKSFNELEKKNAIEAPVKLGHDDKQPLLKTDGLPAAGWLSNVRAVGKYLVADLKKVPKKIAGLIKAGGYRRVSAEIRKNWKDAFGKVHPLMIDGLALLGEKHPAVGNLGDIIDSRYSEDGGEYENVIFQFAVDNDDLGSGGDSYEKSDDDADDIDKSKEGDEMADEYKAKYEELCNKYEELKKKFKASEEELEDFKSKYAKLDEEKKVVDKDNDDMKKKFAESDAKVKEYAAKFAKLEADEAEMAKKKFSEAIAKKVAPAFVGDFIQLWEAKSKEGKETLDAFEREMFSRPDSQWLEKAADGNGGTETASEDYDGKKAEAEKYAKDNSLDIKKADVFAFCMKQVGYKQASEPRLTTEDEEYNTTT